MKKTINNNIEERHCSFEVCKLLKDKGFERNYGSCYTMDGEYYSSSNLLSKIGWNQPHIIKPEFIPAPTYEVAREWIKVNFGYHIDVSPREYKGETLMYSYYVSLEKDFTYCTGLEFPEISNPNDIPTYPSEYEALEEGLKYVLTERIVNDDDE